MLGQPSQAYPPSGTSYTPPANAFAQPAQPSFVFSDPVAPMEEYEQVFDASASFGGPVWFGGFGGLIMTRSQVNSHSLARFPGGTSALDMRDSINAPWEGGFEAQVGMSIGERSAIEANFWLLAPFEGVATVTSAADGLNSTLDFVTGGPLVITGRPATDFFINSHTQQFERHSQAWNLEVNWLRLYDEPTTAWSVMAVAGVRWFHFREATDYAASTAGTTFGQFDGGNIGHYLNTVTNELVGPQLGARMQYRMGCKWRAYAFPKVAVLGNAIGLDSQLRCGCVSGGSDGFLVSTFSSAFSVLGQVEAGASWQVTTNISLYASYRVVGVSGLAVADDQYRQVVSDAVRNPLINTAGSLILQGALFGGQFAF